MTIIVLVLFCGALFGGGIALLNGVYSDDSDDNQ